MLCRDAGAGALKSRPSTPSTKGDEQFHRLAPATRGHRGLMCTSGRLSLLTFWSEKESEPPSRIATVKQRAKGTEK